MTSLFNKLNFKKQEEICIINAPAEFDEEIVVMKTETKINESLNVNRWVVVFLRLIITTADDN